MPRYFTDLMRERTDDERRGRSPTLDGDYAYKIDTGIEMRHLGVGKIVKWPGDDADASEGLTTRYWVSVPKHVTLKQMRQLLPATYTRIAGCGHSYDCCGCSQRYVSNVRRVRRGQFSFDLQTRYNY